MIRRELGPLVIAIALLMAAGCRSVTAPLPDSFVCAHCACGTGTRTVSAPISCDTLGREPACCYALFIGS